MDNHARIMEFDEIRLPGLSGQAYGIRPTGRGDSDNGLAGNGARLVWRSLIVQVPAPRSTGGVGIVSSEVEHPREREAVVRVHHSPPVERSSIGRAADLKSVGSGFESRRSARKGSARPRRKGFPASVSSREGTTEVSGVNRTPAWTCLAGRSPRAN